MCNTGAPPVSRQLWQNWLFCDISGQLEKIASEQPPEDSQSENSNTTPKLLTQLQKKITDYFWSPMQWLKCKSLGAINMFMCSKPSNINTNTFHAWIFINMTFYESIHTWIFINVFPQTDLSVGVLTVLVKGPWGEAGSVQVAAEQIYS